MRQASHVLIAALLARVSCVESAPAEWTSLFDGRTLAGWKASENPKSFSVKDGRIVAYGPRAHLFYIGDGKSAEFRDFELKVEVMTEPGSNAGIYFHTRYQETGWPGQGFETQVNNTYEGDPRRTGSLYGIEDVKETMVEDKRWWEQHVIVEGRRVVVKIDGKTVVDYTESESATGRRLSSGTFALQAHDPKSIVYFRNIRVRRLDTAPVERAQSVSRDPYEELLSYAPGRSRAALSAIEAQLVEASPEETEAIEGKLLSVLVSPKATVAAKQFVCRMLHRYGTVRSVLPLAKLLPEEKLSHLGRYALSRMSYAEAKDALRAALAKTSGEPRIGIIHALGSARDRPSLPALAGLLKDKDVATARAAATALGKLGSTPAASALEGARARPELRSQATDGLLRCAEVLTHDGQKEAALRIYDSLYKPEQPRLTRTAALDGLVRIRRAKAVPLVIEMLGRAETDMQALAARYVCELGGADVTREFAGRLPGLAPPAQVALVSALAERGDKAARRAVMAMLKSKDTDVRMAAIRAMQALGDAGDVLSLAQAGAETGGKEQSAICLALAGLRGTEAEKALIDILAHDDAKIRCVAIRAVAERNPPDAGPFVMLLAQDPDLRVRTGALAVLPGLVDATCLPKLVKLLVDARTDADRESVRKCIGAISTASGNRAACADVVSAACIATSSAAVRNALVRVLAQIGGSNALWTVRGALNATDESTVDAAVRALCDWSDDGALEALVGLAHSTGNPTHRVLTLRACFRMLAEPKAMAHDDKLATYRRLMAIAERPDERKQAFTGIARVPSIEAIPLIRPHLANPQTKTEAALALAKLARNLIAAHRDEAVTIAREALAASDNETVRKEAQTAIKMADEMADYIMSWVFTGPYLTKPQQKAADLVAAVLGPEGPESEDVEWRPLPVGHNPQKPWSLDLGHAIGGENRAGYLRTYVHSPVDQPARLELGSDDAVKVWLNRRRVHTNAAFRSLKPGEDRVPIMLYRGWNSLMMKVVQGAVDWEACAKIVGREGRRLEGLKVRAELSPEHLPDVVTDPPAELVLAWHMDEAEGSVKDASGRGNGGKLIGEPVRSPGVRGSCVSFDGKDDVVESDAIPTLPIEAGDAWSMNVFVHLEKQPEEISMLAGFGDVKNGQPHGCQRYLVKMHGGIHFWAASVDVRARVPFDLGKWQMITITCDGHLLTMHKNAKALVSSAVKLVDAAPLVRLAPLDHWRKKNRFAGKIDEFTIWRGALTQAQIDALATALPTSKGEDN